MQNVAASVDNVLLHKVTMIIKAYEIGYGPPLE